MMFWNSHPPEFNQELLENLPRRYIPLCDGAFWIFALVNLPGLFIAYQFGTKLWQEEPGAWPVYVVVALVLVQPLLLFWLAADTHRWAVPNRGFYLAACVLVSGLVVGYYLAKFRPEWLMYIEKERYRLESAPSPRGEQDKLPV